MSRESYTVTVQPGCLLGCLLWILAVIAVAGAIVRVWAWAVAG